MAVRVRPFNERERSGRMESIVTMRGPQTILRNPKGDPSDLKSYTYDHSFWSFVDNGDGAFATQAAVYADLGAGVLDNAFLGYNACIFAYGQTGPLCEICGTRNRLFFFPFLLLHTHRLGQNVQHDGFAGRRRPDPAAVHGPL